MSNLQHYVDLYTAVLAEEDEARKDDNTLQAASLAASRRYFEARDAVAKAGTALLEYIEDARMTGTP